MDNNNQVDFSVDPNEAAMNATVREVKYDNHLFGQLFINAGWFSVQRGVSLNDSEPFDQSTHSSDTARNLVKVEFVPLPAMGNRFPHKKTYYADNKAWVNFGMKTLRDLKVSNLKAVDEKYFHAEIVSDGSKYESKTKVDDNGKPVMMDGQAIIFHEMYDSDLVCEEAYAAYKGAKGESPASNGGQVPPNEKDNVAKFLPILWKGSNGDVAVFVKKIQTTTKVKDFFTPLDSEVIAILAEAKVEDPESKIMAAMG